MKLSLNWLKRYVATTLSVQDIADLLTNIGLEVEGHERYESLKGGLDGLVVGHLVECNPHPNANRLSLTKVNAGNKEVPLHIVCGAPNVAKGQKVVVATVGATLYPLNGNPFEIKKSKIRGEVSEGMLCGEPEISLGKDDSGIIVLDADAPIGMPLRDYLNRIGGYGPDKIKVEVDTVYEIGLTPNRSDATSHLGVAFDLAAALQIHYEGQGLFTTPAVGELTQRANTLNIELEIEDDQACPRYSGLCMENVKVGESPQWIRHKLEAIGLTPVNNVVDITNYVLHEFGQPLHAFDYDKIKGKKIIVGMVPEGTSFQTLDGVERNLSAEDLMICNAHKEGMCIAGVLGGMDSAITKETSRLFLESAHFHPATIRRTSKRHNLRTDAATRFEKGTDPNMTRLALERAAQLIEKYAGGVMASGILDFYPNPVERVQVTLSYARINRLTGVDMEATAIKKILTALHMNILTETAEEIKVDIPTNKTDVRREVDVIEEILRIYGYNRIETPDTVNSVLSFAPKPNPIKVKNLIADLLTSNGFFEMMATSMSRSSYYEKLLPQHPDRWVYVKNTSNQHLDMMRAHMVFSGLEVILHNQNYKTTNIRLYEFGKTYWKKEGDFAEQSHLSVYLTGQKGVEHWQRTTKKEVDFYDLKAIVNLVLKRLGLYSPHPHFLNAQVIAEDNPVWIYGLDYHFQKLSLVRFGRLQNRLAQGMGIKQTVYYAEFNWENVTAAVKRTKLKCSPVPKYPSMRRDLALVLDKKVAFATVLKIALKQGKNLLKETNLFDVYEHAEHLGKDKKSYALSFIFQDENKTLKDKEVDKIMNKMMKAYEKQLDALIRKP